MKEGKAREKKNNKTKSAHTPSVEKRIETSKFVQMSNPHRCETAHSTIVGKNYVVVTYDLVVFHIRRQTTVTVTIVRKKNTHTQTHIHSGHPVFMNWLKCNNCYYFSTILSLHCIYNKYVRTYTWISGRICHNKTTYYYLYCSEDPMNNSIGLNRPIKS